MSRRSLVGIASRRSALIVGAGALVTAGVSVGQSLLLTAIVGPGAQTDAFLAAYALFLPVVLLGSTLRGQLVPMFGPLEPEARFRRRATEVSARAMLLGGLLALVVAALAPLTARAVTHGLPADARETAVGALLILAPVAYLQFRAASLSALLAGARRFEASTVIYVAAGIVGLGASAALLGPLGPIGAACGLAIGAGALLVGHELYARRFGIRLHAQPRWLAEREQWALSASLVGYAALGLAQPLNLSIALGAVSSTEGDITLYTFSFLMVGLMLNVTAVSLSLVLLPDLVERLAHEGPRAAPDHLVRVSRLAFVVLAPLMAVYLVEGRMLLHWVLGPIFSAPGIDTLYELGRIFCALAVPLALMQTAVSIAVALRRWRLTAAVALIGVMLQLAAVTVAPGDDPRSVAVAHVLAGTLTAAALLAGLFQWDVFALVRRLARPLAASAALALSVVAVTLPFRAASPLVALAGAGVGVAVYLLLLSWLWPAVGSALLRRSASSNSARSSRRTT